MNNPSATQAELTTVLNIAGRQRMLNQKMCKEIMAQHLGCDTGHEQTYALLRKTVISLCNGGIVHLSGTNEQVEVGPPPTVEIRECLRDQLRKVENFVAHRNHFLQSGEGVEELLGAGDAIHDVANYASDLFAKYIEDSKNMYIAEVALVHNASERGELSFRGDTSKLEGSYATSMASINSIVEATVSPVVVLQSCLSRVAKGDLTAYITREFQGDHAEACLALNSTLDSLNDALNKVNSVADSVASGASQVSDASSALSQGATEQASSLQEITETMRSIAGQTKTNASNASQANELSSKASDVASEGDSLMKGMLRAMSDIDVSSHEIRKVIKVIDEIAFQTNLLALNAAVEAARAGVHGKGFAVVAEEVRSLAARSATAARETTDMIEDSILKVEQGSAIASKTALSLTSIVGGVSKVTELVSQIASASKDQASNINDISSALSQVDVVTQTNTASAEESAAASQELSNQARELTHRLSQFQLRTRETEGVSLNDIPPELMSMIQKMMREQSAA